MRTPRKQLHREIQRLSEQVARDAKEAAECIEAFRLDVLRRDAEPEQSDPPDFPEEDEVH